MGNRDFAERLMVFIGNGRRSVLAIAIVAAVVFGFGSSMFSTGAHAAVASAAREKRLNSKEAKFFVRQLRSEMSIVLYPIVALESTKEKQAIFDKKFKSRGSMTGKTATQIATMFKADAVAAFPDPEINKQITDAVDRYLERTLNPEPKS